MLSIAKKQKNGRRIARIEGGAKDGQYVYITDWDFDKASDEKLSEVKLTDGKLQPLPNKKKVEKLYITAPSGAGKSTFVGNWLGEAKKMWKNQPIYLLSGIEEDAPLDKHDPIRIALNDELIADPIRPEELKDSTIVYDDTDAIRDPKLRQSIAAMRDYELECGRHYNTRMLITSHVFLNRFATMRTINEATGVCFFPKSGNPRHIKIYLKDYLGLDKKTINRILKLPSRWVCVYRSYPNYVMYERGVFPLVPTED